MEVIGEILAEAARLLDCSAASIWLIDRQGEGLRCFYGLDGLHTALRDFRLRPGEGIAGLVAQTGQPMVVNDVGGEPRHSPRVDRLLGQRTTEMLTCPLWRSGKVIGAVSFLNRTASEGQGKFDDEDVLLAQACVGVLTDFIVDNGLWSPPALSLKGADAQAYRGGGRPYLLAGDPEDPVFMSAEMQDFAAKLRDSGGKNILFTGETGVGKDLMARWAHRVSSLRDGPFVQVDCPRVPAPLFESELFGHARGAYTGAERDKPGLVEMAHGGTLFLNEIGDMAREAQAKLLTFLDSGEFNRVGETRPRQVRVRVISATNRDLEGDVDQCGFRGDLYFRLAAMHFHISPLRERPADILGIAALRLHRLAQNQGIEAPWVEQELRDFLTSISWRGNGRELISAVDEAFEAWRRSKSERLRPEHFGRRYHAARAQITRRASDASALEAALGPEAQARAEEAAEGAREGDEGRVLAALARALLKLSVGSGKGPGEASSPSGPTPIPTPTPTPNSIFLDPEGLRAHLDQNRCSTGRWNLSAAHRRLVELGLASMGRRAFARRVRQLFPRESEGSIGERRAAR